MSGKDGGTVKYVVEATVSHYVTSVAVRSLPVLRTVRVDLHSRVQSACLIVLCTNKHTKQCRLLYNTESVNLRDGE